MLIEWPLSTEIQVNNFRNGLSYEERMKVITRRVKYWFKQLENM